MTNFGYSRPDSLKAIVSAVLKSGKGPLERKPAKEYPERRFGMVIDRKGSPHAVEHVVKDSPRNPSNNLNRKRDR